MDTTVTEQTNWHARDECERLRNEREIWNNVSLCQYRIYSSEKDSANEEEEKPGLQEFQVLLRKRKADRSDGGDLIEH